MACKIFSTEAGKTLLNSGLTFPEGFFETESFIKDFGNWPVGEIKYKEGRKRNRVNPDGSPYIMIKGDQAYYYNKAHYRVPIVNVEFASIPADLREEISYAVNDALMYELYNRIGLNKLSYGDIEVTETISDSYDIIVKEFIDNGDTTPVVVRTLQEDKADHIRLMKQRLSGLGIKYSVESVKEEAEYDDTDDVDVSTREKYSVVQKPSYERKASSSAGAEIRFMLEFTPQVDPLTGEGIDSIYVPGVPAMMDPSKVFAVLLEKLANIPALLENNAYYSNTASKEAKSANQLDAFITALESLEDKYPWVENITYVVKNESQEFQLEFVAAFNLVMNKIYTSEIDSKGNYKTMDTTNSAKDVKFIIRDWAQLAANTLYSGDKNSDKASKKKLQALVKSVKENLPTEAWRYEDNEEAVKEVFTVIKPLFNFLDMPVDEATFNNYINAVAKPANEKQTSMNNEIVDKAKAVIQTFEDISNSVNAQYVRDNVYKGLGRFAESYSDLYTEIADYMATVGAKRIYLYSAPTVLQRQIEEFKSDSSIIENLIENVKSYSNSIWLKNFAEHSGKLQNFKVGLRGQLQKAGQSIRGKDAKSIGKADYLKNELYNALRYDGNGNRIPLFTTQVPADKNREYILNPGVFVETTDAYDAYKKVFKGYIKDELFKMYEAHGQIQAAIEKNDGDLDKAVYDLQKGYHFDGNAQIFKDGLYAGNAFKLRLFEGLESVPEMAAVLNRIRKGDFGDNFHATIDAQFEHSKFDFPVGTYIEGELEKIFVENQMYMQDYNVKYTTENKDIAFNSIDSNTKKQYRKKYDHDVALINEAIVRDFTVNSMIAKIEYAKLFTGSLQYYKDDSVYIKRVPGTYVDGRPIVTGLTDGDINFDVMVFDTVSITDSELLNADSGLNEFVKDYYRYVDRTDGQGWITPDRWEFLLRRTGKLNKDNMKVLTKLKKQWEEVKNGRPISQEYKITAKESKLLSAQPMKGVYFKNDPLTGPVYLKYSQAVLIPSIASNQPKMRALMQYMDDNNISEAIADSGIKVGGQGAVTLFDENDNFIAPDAGVHKQTLDNRYWRLQQDLPTKTVKDNKIGTQIQKIIVSELRTMGDTQVTQEHTASQLADEIDGALAELSNAGVRSFKKEYGIAKSNRITSLQQFYAPILKDMESDGIPFNNLRQGLRAEYPLQTMPNVKDKVLASFLANMKRAATNLLSSGGGLIQISDHLMGLTEIKQTSGVKMLIDSFDRLQPPKLVDNVVQPGQIFIPHKMISELIPDYMSKSIAELNEMLPAEVKRIIGYRIPTQSRASTDLFEVVGILPPEAGDSIIAYGEITAKTGSDFDIDKIYFMMPELVKVSEEIYSDATITKEEVEEEQTVDVEGIQGFVKPELDYRYLTVLELRDKEDMMGAKLLQDEVEQDSKELESLIKCLWG